MTKAGQLGYIMAMRKRAEYEFPVSPEAKDLGKLWWQLSKMTALKDQPEFQRDYLSAVTEGPRQDFAKGFKNPWLGHTQDAAAGSVAETAGRYAPAALAGLAGIGGIAALAARLRKRKAEKKLKRGK